MNIIAHGIDIVECARLEQSLERHGQRFLDRVFTLREQEYCRSRKKGSVLSYSGRFAVKEAVLKVLGTGWAKGIAWTDVEVCNSDSGKPEVILHGICSEIARDKKIEAIHVSISHTDNYAVGSAIAVGRECDA